MLARVDGLRVQLDEKPVLLTGFPNLSLLFKQQGGECSGESYNISRGQVFTGLISNGSSYSRYAFDQWHCESLKFEV